MEAATPQPPPPPPPPDGPALSGAGAGTYPVRFEADRAEHYNRFLPLVKWLLAFPHYIVLFFIFIGAFFALVASFFAVLFTGRWPRGLFDFTVGAVRWGTRVNGYVYLLTDQYPPFSLEDDPSYPVRLEIDYPEHVNNWRPLVHWLLIIPYYIVTYLLLLVAGVVALIMVFVILFTAKFPEGMFNLIENAMRWSARTVAYMYWMVTEYPPFEWEG